VTRTTLSVDEAHTIIAALEQLFTNIVGPDTEDICYATQNRQAAVRELTKLVDVVLVVGAKTARIPSRPTEIRAGSGIPSYSIADGRELEPEWVRGVHTVGITAGASASEVLVEDLIEALRRLGPVEVSTLPGREETIEFRLPPDLATA
jgi:4-hydroxy-3-methylbut-2-enyl diphosphate reductase